MSNLRLLFLILLTTSIYAQAVSVDEKTKFKEILSHSEVYIDNTKSLNIDDIKKKDIEFKENTEKRLSFGYSPDFNVWIKFTLENKTDNQIIKILEYANSMTTHITLYDIKENRIFKDGLLQINDERKSLNPLFELKLQAYEQKTYYIKISSYITTMIVKLNLWEVHAFYKEEVKHQSILQLFFGAMVILVIYNLFVYLFTKDISYLYYVMYIFGIILHHLMYVGIAHTYFIKSEWLIYSVQYAAIFIAFPVLFLALFSKKFIRTIQYKRFNKILNIFILILPLSVVFFIMFPEFAHYRNILSITLLIFLIILAVYASLKNNRQAHFIIAGWFVILIGGVTMYFSSTGVIVLFQKFPYIVELTFITEALLFSIALADKINHLQEERDTINKELILHQETEKERLEIEVETKTKELQKSLFQQTTLLQELNHRVKNNMQTIISLVRLQADEVQDRYIQDMFVTIENRINAMSYLHELLYKKSDITSINTYEYFSVLIDNLQVSFDNEVKITYNITTSLQIEPAISCGLILNELIINSFKYAFDENSGNIKVELYKENGSYHFNISDDGKGYIYSTKKNSFGLILVNSLVEDHLQGEIKTSVTNGVNNSIVWKEEF